MKKYILSLSAKIPTFVVLLLLMGSPAGASAVTLSANETQSNGGVSTIPALTLAGGVTLANGTLPAVTFAGGVNQVKATRTLTILSVPADGVTLTVGTCVITFSTAATQDMDCSNNNAAVNTSTDTTNLTVAARLQTLTGVSAVNHGALTVGAPSGTTVSFTTTNTETSATSILPVTLSGGASITLTTIDTAGVIGVSGTVTVAITGALAANATDHSVTIDGVVINLGTAALTTAQVASAIAGTSFAAGTSFGTLPYTVTPSTANLTFTRTGTGTAGNAALTLADTSYTSTNAAAASTTVAIPGPLAANATDHSVTVDGVVINLGTSALTATQVAAAIAAATFTSGTSYVANGAYTATSSAANLTFTRSLTGTAGNAALALADANYGPASQVVTFTPGDTAEHALFTITINGTDYTYDTTVRSPAVKDIVEGLVSSMASNTAVSCTENDVIITCTATVAGVAFTYSSSANIIAVVTTSSSSSRSGTRSSQASVGGSTSTTVVNDAAGNQISSVTTVSTASGPASMPSSVSSGNFAATVRPLSTGSSGTEVTGLQKFLNSQGYSVALSGPGSPGNETLFFGALTTKALASFQAAHGITPSVGYFGPITKAYIKAHFQQ